MKAARTLRGRRGEGKGRKPKAHSAAPRGIPGEPSGRMPRFVGEKDEQGNVCSFRLWRKRNKVDFARTRGEAVTEGD